MTIAYIGLGSNLDEPTRQVEQAIHALSQLPDSRLLQVSDFYASRAIGPGVQPDYINAAVALETQLQPEALLDQLQVIELNQGRIRSDVRWTARTMDLDVLLYGELVIASERLQIPHPYAKARNFVLLPLYDLAPNLIFPDGEPLQSLMNNLSRDGISRLKTE